VPDRLVPRLLLLIDGLCHRLCEILQERTELVGNRAGRSTDLLGAHHFRNFVRRDLTLLEVLRCEHFVECSPELADVLERDASQSLCDARVELLVAFIGLLANDRDPGLVLGRSDIDDQATRESRQEARVQTIDIGRRSVACQHDLAPCGGQLVERPQQHLLCFHLPGQELDIVEKEDLQVRVLVLERVSCARLERRLELLQVFLERHVLDLSVRFRLDRLVGNRRKNVRLSEPGRRIQKEWVVARPG
jgi:hypothetical protein